MTPFKSKDLNATLATIALAGPRGSILFICLHHLSMATFYRPHLNICALPNNPSRLLVVEHHVIAHMAAFKP